MWFAWKFVPLWYQQQQDFNNFHNLLVVICLKICTFVVSATTRNITIKLRNCCDLLENLYLCGISNNIAAVWRCVYSVVICLKICTFVVSATTYLLLSDDYQELWFAWKFVPLWYQQQLNRLKMIIQHCCDLLENLYLCGISNNRK